MNEQETLLLDVQEVEVEVEKKEKKEFVDYNLKFFTYADDLQMNNAKRSLFFLGAVIREIRKVEKDVEIKPTAFPFVNINFSKIQEYFYKAYQRVQLFERENKKYKAYHSSTHRLLGEANLCFELASLEWNLSPYEAVRLLGLGAAIADKYVVYEKANTDAQENGEETNTQEGEMLND